MWVIYLTSYCSKTAVFPATNKRCFEYTHVKKRAAWILVKTSLLCFTEEWKSYMFKMTWGWAKDEIKNFREIIYFYVIDDLELIYGLDAH